MSFNIKKIVSLSAVLFSISGTSAAQVEPLSEQANPNDASACVDQRAVIIDGVLACQNYSQDTLAAIIDDMERDNKKRNPIEAGDEGAPEALHRLPDVSLKADHEKQAFTRTLLTRVKAIPPASLHGQDRLNAELLEFVLSQKLLKLDHDQARIPFTNDSGFFNMMSYVSRQTRFVKPLDYEAYAARLSALPHYFDQNIDNMRRGMRTHFTAARVIMPGIIESVDGLASGTAKDHPFFKPFLNFPGTFSEADKTRLYALGLDAIQNQVMPAYQNLETFFTDEYMPTTRTSAGIGTTLEGREFYKAAVKYYTTLDLTPDEIHEIGLSEVSRIRAEMDDVIKETGFTGDFKSFLEFLRTDPQFYATSKKDLLKEASYIAKRIDGQMPRFFGKLPRLSYGVLPVPDEMAKNYTTGRYWSGSLAQGIAGNYMVNTYNLKMRPLYNLPALTLHEGVPGHHHQISLSQELSDVPNFRRDLYPNAFGEGWGLYAEKLGEEMGIYATPYEHFGRLTYEIWRACRLVVDTGMHWKGWSQEKAEACFLENSALAEHNIRTEVERYISWPGQALAYKIGELKIIELRTRAQKALGDDFDIRAFHDKVLSNGGIPLRVLEVQIDDWIGEKNRNTP